MKIKELDDKRKTPSEKVILSFQVDEDLFDEFIRITELEDVTRSVLLRHILEEFIKNYNKK